MRCAHVRRDDDQRVVRLRGKDNDRGRLAKSRVSRSLEKQAVMNGLHDQRGDLVSPAVLQLKNRCLKGAGRAGPRGR